MNTSFAHLGLVVGGQDGAPSKESLVEHEIVARDAPPLRAANVVDGYDQRVGAVVLIVGLALIILGALVS